eukprot:TRINITY_DN32046_c1_g1_i1.p1 TRINITY_DN32046_c1_g1~~TRINITY_DN32046_c1_g1_i1.p1  ORF type:complete len:108 (-),score=7.70 TRINITY_DN32046_c1_g1_i1:85-378(-)
MIDELRSWKRENKTRLSRSGGVTTWEQKRKKEVKVLHARRSVTNLVWCRDQDSLSYVPLCHQSRILVTAPNKVCYTTASMQDLHLFLSLLLPSRNTS